MLLKNYAGLPSTRTERRQTSQVDWRSQARFPIRIACLSRSLFPISDLASIVSYGRNFWFWRSLVNGIALLVVFKVVVILMEAHIWGTYHSHHCKALLFVGYVLVKSLQFVNNLRTGAI